MTSRDPETVTAVVLEAIRRVGVRAVLSSGWDGLGEAGVPDSVCVVDAVSHDALFPHCVAVVHHGGAGTTATGLRAGRPTVVCPFFGDQFFWGRRVRDLGAGPAPVPQKHLTPGRLASALRLAAHAPHVRRRAARLGTALRQETGVANAVEIIEAARRSR